MPIFSSYVISSRVLGRGHRCLARNPADGLVGQRQVRVGQFINVGTQVIAVVLLPNIWVIANFKETQMTNVRIGNPATVAVDAFPDPH
jgi:membrane fusion protein, multidrug efflux system